MKTLVVLSSLFLFCNLGARAFGETVPLWSADQKVILVILENTSYSEAMKAPFLSEIAKNGALLTNYHAIGHPSEPNYVALIAGDTLGVTADDQYDLSSTSIADLLETQGKTWRVYAEGFPGNCFTGMTSGKYARKHVPFMSFKNISTDPKRCANITDSTSFANDFNSGTLPNYSMYIPNLDDDGHDTNVTFADTYMNKTFSPLIANQAAMANVLIIITFDEDDSLFGGSNQVYAAFYGPSVKAGTQISTSSNHYDVLRTIEDGFGLGNLGRNDAKATALTGLWQ